ncbi:MAG: DUF975 family protein [Candidatus Pacebacteria bacterium]|nr:DUF975 family protein [Candidatus Paceibacterota bacterium]MBP9851677.1 DUF975 family protein [Candidatus Paceibacterota bacterium]
MKTFSIREAFRFGWKEFKKAPWVYIGVAVVIGFINSLGRVENLGIVASVVGIAASLGVIKITLNAVDGKKPEMNDIFSQWNLFWKYLGMTIVMLLMLLIPFIVIGIIVMSLTMPIITLISPGLTPSPWLFVILAAMIVIVFMIILRYMFAPYLVVDKNMKIMESFKKSSAMTKGYRWKLLGMMFFGLLINLLGVIALVVGVLITMMVTYIAQAYVYRKLLEKHNSVAHAAHTHTHEHTHTNGEHSHSHEHAHTHEHNHSHHKAEEKTEEETKPETPAN